MLEAKTDKYEWIRYFEEYRNISGLSRAAAVELIDRVRVFDKNHIEIDFAFDDCFQSALRQVRLAEMTAGMEAAPDKGGSTEIRRREAV